jgi:hypothetical protein
VDEVSALAIALVVAVSGLHRLAILEAALGFGLSAEAEKLLVDGSVHRLDQIRVEVAAGVGVESAEHPNVVVALAGLLLGRSG